MVRTATVAELAPFSLALLKAAGADDPSAEAATWAMLHASLHGVDSKYIYEAMLTGREEWKGNRPRR